MKLPGKILLLITPLVAAPLVGFGLLSYEREREHAEGIAVEALSATLDQIASETRFQLDTARANATLFAASALVEQYLLTQDERDRFELLQPGILELFATFLHAYPGYYEIRLILPDGFEDTRATRGSIPNDTDEEAETPYFRELSRRPENVLAQVVRNPDVGAPALMVSRRVQLVDLSVDPVMARPRTRGYLVITADLGFLQRAALEDRHDRTQTLLYTDGEGRPLFHDPPAASWNRLSDAVRHALVRGVRSGGVSKVAFGDYRFRIAGRKLHDGLLAFAMVPESVLQERAREVARWAAAITLLAVVVSCALLFAALRPLVLRPLARLGAAAVAIGQGRPAPDLDTDRGDEIGQLAECVADMSRRLTESHQKITHLAHHDSLTGLPNRRLFGDLATRLFAAARRNGTTVAVLFLDVDDFKDVNDTFGHETGDALLQALTERLSGLVRPYDGLMHSGSGDAACTLARLGGDEFTALIPGLGEPVEAAPVARRMLDSLAHPIRLSAGEFFVSASVGITTFPQDGETLEELTRNADIAMYHAKSRGKNGYRFFTEEMNAAVVRRTAIERALRDGLRNGEFSLHYQPQVDIDTSTVVGVEALLRWNSAALGQMAPDDFIPVAEATGLILPLGEWVLREAMRQAVAWREAGMDPFTVSVNVSGRQLEPGVIDVAVKRALADSGMDPEWLQLEITESSVMAAQERAVAILRNIKRLGARIAMDDFGTGYSSLGLLRRLPLDTLKIDRAFVRDLRSDRGAVAIAATIVALGRSLGLQVVAEGVEHTSQVDVLRSQGCRLVQGFLYSRPLPADEVPAFVDGRAGILAARAG